MQLSLSHYGCWNGRHQHYVQSTECSMKKTHWYQLDRFTWSVGMYMSNGVVFRFFLYRIIPSCLHSDLNLIFQIMRYIVHYNPNFKIGGMK